MFLTAHDRAIRPVLEPGAIVSDEQAEHLLAAEAATEVGFDTRPAALSMERHRKTAGRVVLALLAVPALAAFVAVFAFAAQHWPMAWPLG